MTIEEINRIAFMKGVDPAGKPKWEIIRMIQIKEGNQPCYGTQQFSCPHTSCLWRKDCLGLIRIVEVSDGPNN